jgi:putative transposase
VIDCCTREIVGWNLSHRCRTEDALAAVEQAVLERLPEGSREANVTLTTDNGTQFTSSRFLETNGLLRFDGLRGKDCDDCQASS